MKLLAVVASAGLVAAVGCSGTNVRVEQPGPAPDPHAGLATVATRTVAQLPSAETGSPATTDAAPTPPGPNDAQVVGVPIAGTDLVRGRGTIKVNAPIDKVREVILHFSQYPEFMPHYRKTKVLGRTPSGGKDVYMEIEALNGAVTFWTRIDVPQPATVDGYETYDTKYLDGNVKDFKAIWRIKKLDEATTELSLEIFLQPRLPMPDRIMNGENLKGAATGVTAMRARIESK